MFLMKVQIYKKLPHPQPPLPPRRTSLGKERGLRNQKGEGLRNQDNHANPPCWGEGALESIISLVLFQC